MISSRPKKRREQVPNLAMDEQREGMDLFDDLPNSILEYILSMLTINDAVNTSRISHRWRHLWCGPILTRRNLEINCPNVFGSKHIGPMHTWDTGLYSYSEKQVFVRRVDAFLQLYHGNKVDSFRVNYFFDGEWQDSSVLDQWVRFAITKGVEVLELRLFRGLSNRLKHYVFPSWLLSSSTINHLSLYRCILRCGIVNGFSLLRTLHLHCVDVDEEFMSQLFTVSLLLESLTLRSCNVGSRFIVAGGPSLALNDLKLISCYMLSSFEIHAENLASLEYFGNRSRIVAIRAPRLDKIFFATGKPDDILSYNLRKFASSAKLGTLYLHLFTEIPQILPTFTNLKQLNLDLLRYRFITENVDLVPVLNLLNLAPALEELTLTVVGSNMYKNEPEMRDLSGFKHDNLRKVKMQGFQSNVYEIEFVICILKNAAKLQQIIIDPFGKLYFGGAHWVEVKSYGRQNYNDSSWEERRKMVVQEKLKQVRSDAQIIIL